MKNPPFYRMLFVISILSYSFLAAEAFTPGYGGKLVGNRIAYRHGNIEYGLARAFNGHASLNLTAALGDAEITDFGQIPPPLVPILQKVYFGNWLRDYSTFINEHTLAHLPKSFLISAVKLLAKRQFPLQPEFKVNEANLGVYRHEQHFDNPYHQEGNPSELDPRLPGPIILYDLEVEGTTGSKRYMQHSLDYVMNELEWSLTRFRASDVTRAYQHLGSALHVIEDFYAHSNFIELTMIEMGYGYDQVFPYVGRETAIRLNGEKVYPLVSGGGSHKHFHIEVLSLIKDIFLEKLANKQRMLQAMSQPSQSNGNEEKSKLEKNWQALVNIFRAKWAKIVTIPLLEKAISVLNKGIAKRTEKDQRVFEEELWSNPTHAQLGKDHLDHPLNEIAGYVASVASAEVARRVVAVWEGAPGHSLYHLQGMLQSTMLHPHIIKDKTSLGYSIKRAIKDWAIQDDNISRRALLTRERASTRRMQVPIIEELSRL